MASLHKTCMLLLSMLIIFNHHHASPIFVNGDAALINTICRKTREQNACLECLRSNPQASDLRGYVFTSIDCALRQTQVVRELLNSLTGGRNDPSLNAAYAACERDLLTVGTRLLGATDAWRSRTYRAAQFQASAAVDIFNGNCGGLLGKVPPNVAAALSKEGDLLKDAQDVIRQIMP